MAVAFALAVLLAPLASADSALPGNRFPIIERQLFLSPEIGNAGGNSGVLLLVEDAPAAQESINFVAPGVNVLGVINTQSTESWFTEMSWDKDLEVVDDAVAILYFQANPQGLTVFQVRLYDVAPDGQPNLVASDEKQFVTAIDPTPIEFELTTTGVQVHQGHILRLEVTAQTANAVVVLQYGGDTPSAVQHLFTRWLDTDGDGVPDSDESAVNRNPLNPNDPTDDSPDSDDDGLSDQVEASIGTNPAHNDTDNDGFGDGLEVHAGSNPKDAASKPYDVNQNGLPDNFETTYFSNTTFNNSTTVMPTSTPCNPGPNCVNPSADPDEDGCGNLCEAKHGTDPNDPDTDDDGVIDGKEVDAGTDPSTFTTILGDGVSGVPEPVATAMAFALGTTICLIALLRRP